MEEIAIVEGQTLHKKDIQDFKDTHEGKKNDKDLKGVKDFQEMSKVT